MGDAAVRCPVGTLAGQRDAEQGESGCSVALLVRLQKGEHLIIGAGGGVADLDGKVSVSEGERAGGLDSGS
ncbi:hypothetical protein GCM10010264_12660 [Streptomyces globisporus]|nr:hypothetical protein GCM10010264_12660 [Streptomyces globisporus]